MVIKLVECDLETTYGLFHEVLYYDGMKEYIALCKGDITGENVLCRLHSSCISAHVFNSIQCDCRYQFDEAQRMIAEENRGVIIWMDQEGKGNGHLALMKSSEYKAKGYFQTDAYKAIGFKADNRDYIAAAEILRDLQVHSICLLSNSPLKEKALIDNGITIMNTKRIIVSSVKNNPKLKHAILGKISVGHNINIDEIEV